MSNVTLGSAVVSQQEGCGFNPLRVLPSVCVGSLRVLMSDLFFFFPSCRVSTHFEAMGCGLRKMKPVSEESSPGKIYSTLKRPQVETKVGVAYAYRYLDFLIGKDGKT